MKRSIVIICYLILFVILQVPAFGKLNTSTDSDLQDLCESLNLLVLPEYITHASLTLLLLCGGSWFTFLLNLPLVAYHVFKYKNRLDMPRPGLYDPITIMDPCNLNYASNEAVCKALFYFISVSCY